MSDSFTVENVEAAASKPAVHEPSQDRRKLFRRLVALAGLGITGALVSQDKLMLLPEAHATTYMAIDAVNVGLGTTTLDSHGSPGVYIISYSDGAVPLRLAGYSPENGNIQEWYNDDGAFELVQFSAMDAQGYLSLGRGSGTGNLSNEQDGGIAIQGLGNSKGASDLGLRINNTTSQGNEWYIDSTGSDGTNTSDYGPGKLVFVTPVGGTPTMSLTPSAVGIGTTDPGYPLQIGNVGGTDPSMVLATEGPMVSVGTGMNDRKALVLQGIDTHASFHGGAKISAYDYQAGAGRPLSINPDNSDVYLAQNGGNVGIGTTSPARSVHLQSSNAVFRMDRDVNSSAFILTRTAAGNFSTIWKTFYVGVDASGSDNGSFFIGDRHTGVSGDSDRRLIIDNAGLVGVGRTPTANNLEVEGTASKTAAGSWLANSDQRIKTNIQDLDDPLGVIGKLHPVRFQYTQEYRRKHPSIKDHPYYNFIAQEYREVFPDSVRDDGEGLLQMDDHNVTPYLVAAVQQLRAEVEEKTKTINELKARLETVEGSIKPVIAS